MTYDFDLFVIGAGSGGIATARRAAQYGAKVGIVESDRLGGTCVNRGCVPKKLMVYASHFPAGFEESAGYGWTVGETSFDWHKMITAVNDEVTRLNGIYSRMLDNSGVKLYEGYGKFVDSHTIAIGDQKVTAEKILVAVGGKPVKPDHIKGIEHAITSREIFNVQEQPKRMVIIGGGYIGVEFACILNGLGTEVTVVIRGDKILRGFDEDIRDEIQAGMENHGIKFVTGCDCDRMVIDKTDSGLKITVPTQDGKEETIIADAASLAATGRMPDLKDLGLENTKIEVANGAVVVDEYNKTAEDHIYAVGDCTDRINLTPVAINEGRAFADTHFGGMSRQMSYENIPTAVFTTPEAATVGLTEAEAREKYGDAVKIYRSKFRPMYYTLAGKEEKTLMKLIVETTNNKVVGAHMVGDSAAEIIQGVAIAVKMGATKANFDATVGIHPSSAEEFVTMR
ncbi:glutathione-disulfide reductase [Waterburya agarophytonicola K14]|uniref:Glutathione reductase n=1 Tax=Waterburya agarophytonicola KI4 TaxID=2874699 RepID=A0A964FHD8_9CYAN|nr:glutathione-disulfide reductase [Waterburya agarophytonicola]MCC0179066.1 glutathione-disulfide reductase [Waterburya agarophytonicola KI4]